MNQFCTYSCILILTIIAWNNAFSQVGHPLQPVSGADGVFETVNMEGETVYRSKATSDGYHFYMYFKTSEEIIHQTVYVEVSYLDIGYDMIGIQYNASQQDYMMAQTGFNNFVLGTGRKRTAVFELPDADFRDAQNLETDLRLYTQSSLQMHIISATLFTEPTPLFNMYNEDFTIPYDGPVYEGDQLVDSDSLTGKVICGYQGWFRAAGDPAGQGWGHYIGSDFTDLTVEMWPDMLEYTDEEKYPVPGWTHTDGSQATLFSSANKRTVLRHFQWMETYGIDGVAVQRFISRGNLYFPRESFRIPSYAREAANRTGRTYYIMYDMSGCDTTLLVDALTTDWQFLVDSMKITEDERYLHHGGTPVVGIFGFYSDRFSAALGNEVLDVFQNNGPYRAYVAGSGQWWIQQENSSAWTDVFERMDAWIPWNIGNYNGDYAQTDYWNQDNINLSNAGVMYMPLIYPGFSWDNLMNEPPGTTYKSRLEGVFMWQQFLQAKHLNARAVYVAMFDEIDEGTAIFKVTNDIPVNHYFIDLEGLPSDFYLLLTGEGTRMMRGEIPVPPEMPDFSLQSQPPIPDILVPRYGDTVTSPFTISWSAVEHATGVLGYELEIDDQEVSETTTTRELELEDGTHSFRVRAINGLENSGGWSETLIISVNNSLSIKESCKQMPDALMLMQNYPNPFDAYTIFQLSVPEQIYVTLEVFNMDGKKVVTLINSRLNPGIHKVIFTPEGVPAGIYICRLTGGNTSIIRKITIMK